MSYYRVIPRDLFNEANLLKCYGQLYLNLEKIGKQSLLLHNNWPFDITMDVSSGELSINNVGLFIDGNEINLFRPLNSHGPYPLYAYVKAEMAADEEIGVFNDDGSFSHEFKQIFN